MVEEFLDHKNIPESVADFKDTWYGIAQKYEAVMDCKSGLGEDCQGAFEGIRDTADALQKKTNLLNVSIKRSVPEKRSEVDSLGQEVKGILERFAQEALDDTKSITESRRLHKALEEATSMLDETERKYREVQSRTSEVCSKYVGRKGEYNQEAELIKGATRERVGIIRKKHLSKIQGVCDGYNIYIAGKDLTAEVLFDILVERPKTVESVKLVKKEQKKGFLDSLTGKKEAVETIEAKYAVLKYTTKEIGADVIPIKKEETQAFVRLDTRFGELRKLEFECKDAESKREEVAGPREELKREIGKLQKSELLDHATYDHILKVHDKYLNMFQDANPKIKEYIAFMEQALEGYEVLEKDPEKRELKNEIKGLREGRKSLEEEVLDLEKKIRVHQEEIKALKDETARLNGEVEGALEREREAKAKAEGMQKTVEALKAKHKEIEQLFQGSG